MLQKAGEAYQQKMQALYADKPLLCPGPFRMGFHSIPSMKQLHMHVISQVSAIMQDVTHLWLHLSSGLCFDSPIWGYAYQWLLVC